MKTMQAMQSLKAARKQKGFTIIELVVVILLLGILAATALPRFMDVTEQAHDAAVDGVEGGLATATALFRAQWVAEGQPSTAVSGFGLNNVLASANGAPARATAVTGVSTGATFGSGICVDLWNSLLQSGRPTVASVESGLTAIEDGLDLEGFSFEAFDPATVADASESVSFVAFMDLEAANTGTDFYLATPVVGYDPETDMPDPSVGGFFDDNLGTNAQAVNLGNCTYYYVGEYKQLGDDLTVPAITLNLNNGEITRAEVPFEP